MTLLATVLVLGSSMFAAASPPQQPASGALALEIERLRVVGSVLYVAAHPDDENTRLLAYLMGERKLRTAYLSLTRGDGGQNLIGPERGPMFGLLRTAELLEARRLDGAEQLFTRAVDFGYSKSSDEALKQWRYPDVLVDVVRAIRRFRPDVVIARFSADDARTHGHHSASARLATEAFAAAADPSFHPEQLDGLKPWKASRLLWNKSTWSKQPDDDWSADLPTDVGGYNPLLGLSYGEIAGRSRSMHKSQGFGARQQRGPILEYFEVLEGDRPAKDFLGGLDFSWKRAGGDDELIALLERISATFRPQAPHQSIPLLLDARRRIGALPDSPPKRYKLGELDDVIVACAGLWLEATADGYVRAPGEALTVTATALNRSPLAVRLVSVAIGGEATGLDGEDLAENQPVEIEHDVTIPATTPDSTPPWLRERPDGALYRLARPELIGEPQAAPALEARFQVEIGEEILELRRAVDFKWVDPVVGERRRPIEIHPAVSLTLDRNVLVFADSNPRPVRLVAKAGAASVRGRVRLEVPDGWRVEPRDAELVLEQREAEKIFSFRVWPPARDATSPVGAKASQVARLLAVADVDGRALSRGLARIEYPHVPIQTLFPQAEARLVTLDLTRGVGRIGYVAGAGDDVAASLSDVGYEVVSLDEDDLTDPSGLAGLDAVVLGVRAYNVHPRLRFHHATLMEWVEGGGTLVTQYNTVNRLSGIDGPIGPWPFEITRLRVTDEASPVRLETAVDPVFQHPNRIGREDFDGWVQERGLYFASTKDARYRMPLLLRDGDEPWFSGGLLVADYGKGRFVYTGLSFFRQLPAGVAGAYRLFANLLSHRPAAPAEGGHPVGSASDGEGVRGSDAAEPRTDDQSGVRH